jgi:hypothetical protein
MKVATVVAFCVAGVGVLASCGGKIACDADASAQCTSGGPTVDCTKGVCPNDPVTSEQTAACRAEVAGACGAQYAAFYSCVVPLIKCDATGRTDSSSVGDFLGKCGSQFQAYQTCKTAPGRDAGFK